MKEEYIKEYETLKKKHLALQEGYEKLEQIEQKLYSDDKMNMDDKIAKLTKLSQEYEKLAKMMGEVARDSEQLKNKLESEE